MGFFTTAALIATAVASVGGTVASSVQQAQATKKQTNAMNDQAATANRLADEQRAEKAELEKQSKLNQEKLAAAPALAAEEARKDDMKRRSKQTKTLLTGSLGATDVASTEKKTLLGA